MQPLSVKSNILQQIRTRKIVNICPHFRLIESLIYFSTFQFQYKLTPPEEIKLFPGNKKIKDYEFFLN